MNKEKLVLSWNLNPPTKTPLPGSPLPIPCSVIGDETSIEGLYRVMRNYFWIADLQVKDHLGKPWLFDKGNWTPSLENK